jgi:hypothetical protein
MDTNSFDYTPAEAFGDVVSLRAQNFATGAGGDDHWNRDVVHSLRKQLKNYVPMVDYLIPTGKPLKMCVVSMILMEHGARHQFLAWDAMHYRYIPYSIDLSQTAAA